MRELLKVGTDPNVADYDGWTPLMYAAEGGCKKCVRLLIEAGADINYHDAYTDPSSALQLAQKNGKKECAKLLIDAGADCSDDELSD